MPTCKRCGRDHFNFLKECPDPPKPVANLMGWGSPFGNAARPGHALIATLPPRIRTGNLVEPEPPIAA